MSSTLQRKEKPQKRVPRPSRAFCDRVGILISYPMNRTFLRLRLQPAAILWSDIFRKLRKNRPSSGTIESCTALPPEGRETSEGNGQTADHPRSNPISGGSRVHYPGQGEPALRPLARRYCLSRKEHHLLLSAGDLVAVERAAFPCPALSRTMETLSLQVMSHPAAMLWGMLCGDRRPRLSVERSSTRRRSIDFLHPHPLDSLRLSF
jgi:hypothetical protein